MKTDYEIANCQEPCGLQSGSLPPINRGGKTAKPNSDTLAVFQDTTEHNDMQYNDNTGFCCSTVGKCQTAKRNIDPYFTPEIDDPGSSPWEVRCY